MNKVCETGPPVYRPYPRRLESLTGILQSGVLTTRGLKARGSYNRGFLQPGQKRFLRPGVLTTGGCYDQGYLQPGVFKTRVLTLPGVLTTRGSYNQGSYNQGFLQSGVLQPGLLTTMGS